MLTSGGFRSVVLQHDERVDLSGFLLSGREKTHRTTNVRSMDKPPARSCPSFPDQASARPCEQNRVANCRCHRTFNWIREANSTGVASRRRAFSFDPVNELTANDIHRFIAQLFTVCRWCITLQTLGADVAQHILEGLQGANDSVGPRYLRLLFCGGIGLNDDPERARCLLRVGLKLFFGRGRPRELDLLSADSDGTGAGTRRPPPSSTESHVLVSLAHALGGAADSLQRLTLRCRRVLGSGEAWPWTAETPMLPSGCVCCDAHTHALVRG